MNIAVYCSSSNHIAENYLNTAFELGCWIAKNGHSLVFGGATGGSMSAVSEGAASRNGQIIGVIPTAVERMGRVNTLSTELISVASMGERKEIMKEKSDVFIILPGSYGTLDELFDVLASAIVGEHKKPIIILNENGFYNELIKQTERMREEMFIPVENYKALIARNLAECIKLVVSI
ncbi:MAG: TIGR00730 family Rossman fold protein [Paludibacter sp.]